MIELWRGDLIYVFLLYLVIAHTPVWLILYWFKIGRDQINGLMLFIEFVGWLRLLDNLNGAKVLGRIVRVDHVSKYKKKEQEDEEEEQRKREARGVCRAFQRGDCTRGASCKFSHNEMVRLIDIFYENGLFVVLLNFNKTGRQNDRSLIVVSWAKISICYSLLHLLSWFVIVILSFLGKACVHFLVLISESCHLHVSALCRHNLLSSSFVKSLCTSLFVKDAARCAGVLLSRPLSMYG